MKISRPKVSIISLLGLLIFLACFWFVLNLGEDGYVTEAEREVSRQQVKVLFRDLQSGMTHDEIRDLASGLDRLEFPKTNSKVWRIPTRPVTLMSVEWVVSMEFDDDGKLLGAIVGTYDNVAASPSRAPEEIGNFTVF